VWVTDFTYVRTWTGWRYVAFILDVFAQRIVAWHAATATDVELVMTPLQISIWSPDHDGHPAVGEELIHHSDAGSHIAEVHRAPRPRGHQALDRERRGRYDNALMETLNGVLQDRVHPHHDLPRRPLQDHRRGRVHQRRLGRLVQPGPAPGPSLARSGPGPVTPYPADKMR
jgi:putative transposase